MGSIPIWSTKHAVDLAQFGRAAPLRETMGFDSSVGVRRIEGLTSRLDALQRIVDEPSDLFGKYIMQQIIEQKKAQIVNHERILRENGSSRWYDQSKRYLEGLKQELQDLEKSHAEMTVMVHVVV